MRSEHKHKINHTRIHSTHNNAITYASNTFTQQKKKTQTSQQQLHFHLYDEQPQSLNAKRKLEQFSVSLNEQKMVNSNKRNHHTINLSKKKTLKTHEHENQNIGWTDDNQINIKEQQKQIINQKDKNYINTKKLYTPTHKSLTRTLHVKQKPYKQSSFTSNCYSPQIKINLSFNNLMPNQMEIIRQQQISRQLIKKVKNAQSKRPITASYFAASQKILTLYEKDKQSGKLVGETMRIHSVKDSQLLKGSNNNIFSLKDKERMLKTCTVNSFYFNEKSKYANGNENRNNLLSRQNKNKKIVDLNEQQDRKQLRLTTQNNNNQNNAIKSNHCRTYSQPNKSECKKINFNKNNNNKSSNKSNDRMTLSHRKYQQISDRKTKRLNKIDNNNNKESSLSFSSTARYNNNNNHCQSQQIVYTNNIPTSNTSNNLQQDFNLLTTLLRRQNQHIFGGQLHNYLTQVKHNYQYNNCYMSSTINKTNKKSQSKHLLNQSLNRNKNKKKNVMQNNNNNIGFNNNNNNINSNMSNKTDMITTIMNNQSMNQLITTNDELMNKNNTLKHYKPFSASKHRSKTNNFIISSSQLIYQ